MVCVSQDREDSVNGQCHVLRYTSTMLNVAHIVIIVVDSECDEMGVAYRHVPGIDKTGAGVASVDGRVNASDGWSPAAFSTRWGRAFRSVSTCARPSSQNNTSFWYYATASCCQCRNTCRVELIAFVLEVSREGGCGRSGIGLVPGEGK